MFRLSTHKCRNKGSQLTNRGEAHITVITPIEYYKVLKSKVSIEEIDKIAFKHNIQFSNFEIVCLGRGTAKIENKVEETFYLVINSQDLLDIRQAIYELYLSRGGDINKFNPKKYHPHITLGFSKRDLHISDGVIKGANSCYADLTLNLNR